MKLSGILSLLLLGVFCSGSALADEEPLEEVTVQDLQDYQADARLMQQKKMPMLLSFVADYCHFCETVKEEFLRPMLRNDFYDDRVLIRQINISSSDSVRMPDGSVKSVDEFAAGYNVSLVPVVVFLDASGKELSERVMGITTVDYYGGFLDQGIDASLQQLRKLPVSVNVTATRNSEG